MNCETFDELLDQEYGPQGSPERNAFETEAEASCLAVLMKCQTRCEGKQFTSLMKSKTG